MATYRYLCANLVTNEIIAELPFTGVRYSKELNAAGSLSAHVLLSDIREKQMSINQATIPGFTALYVDRDGIIVWGGIIWTRQYQSNNQSIQITAREFESYYEHRNLQFGLSTGVSPHMHDYVGAWTPDTDVFTVVEDCFNVAHSYYRPNSDIGVIVPNNKLGVSIGLVSNPNGYIIQDYEFRTVWDVISTLSKQVNGQGGFDFHIKSSYGTNNKPQKQLILEAARGKVWDSTTKDLPMLEFPGNVVEYNYPEDGASIATITYGQGNGSGGGTIWWNNPSMSSSVTNLRSISSNLTPSIPLLERVVPVVNESNPYVVGNLTQGAVKAWDAPLVTMTITWDSINDPQINTFDIGDQFRIRINDDRFVGGTEFVYRLTKYDVNAGEDGPERITGTFVNPKAFTI